MGAGIVVTYMRPLTTGDRIKINDITGFVVEKSLMTTRLRTHKNEFVSFPNLTILNATIINYNYSTAEGEDGLVIHINMTFGYATPWTQVHQLLIDSALKTEGAEKEPPPYVLQTALNDFYCNYELNVFTKDIKHLPRVYSKLYESIQNEFKAAGLDMTAAHFYDVNSHAEELKNG
jgi:small-conductance mechanosensitive channel